jgi:integrase
MPKPAEGVAQPKKIFDYRRRKRGRIRRVIPLVDEAVRLMAAHQRPEPVDEKAGELFFLSPGGRPLVWMTESGQQNTVTRKFTKLMVKAGLRPKPIITWDKTTKKKHVKSAGSGDGRGFRALRHTFANLAPANYREEVEIIMGHAHGGILLDRYLERVGLTRLFDLVNAVWNAAASEPPDAKWIAQFCPAPASKDPAPADHAAAGSSASQ